MRVKQQEENEVLFIRTVQTVKACIKTIIKNFFGNKKIFTNDHEVGLFYLQ
jgi:hypothetical protein